MDVFCRIQYYLLYTKSKVLSALCRWNETKSHPPHVPQVYWGKCPRNLHTSKYKIHFDRPSVGKSFEAAGICKTMFT